MQVATNLFGEEIMLKIKRERSAKTKVKTGLNALIKKEGFYHFKIIFNRVYYGKVKHMPSSITKEEWLEVAMQAHADSKYWQLPLIDKKKANQ